MDGSKILKGSGKVKNNSKKSQLVYALSNGMMLGPRDFWGEIIIIKLTGAQKILFQ